MQSSAPREDARDSMSSFDRSKLFGSKSGAGSDKTSTNSSERVDVEQGKHSELPAERKHEPVLEMSWEKDKANARNWSKFQRIYHTFIPGKFKIMFSGS
jgi:hypothetical protein